MTDEDRTFVTQCLRDALTEVEKQSGSIVIAFANATAAAAVLREMLTEKSNAGNEGI